MLTGIADTMAAREVHQLRGGRGGDDPPVVRDDSATCWRVCLQTNTAAARRMHFWRLVDGRIELSRVVYHDDMTPETLRPCQEAMATTSLPLASGPDMAANLAPCITCRVPSDPAAGTHPLIDTMAAASHAG